MADQTDAWYVHENGEQSGPFTRADIRSFMAQGSLTSAAMVWREGMTEWAKVTTIVPPQIRPAVQPEPEVPILPIEQHIRKAQELQGWLAQYKRRVGIRSFIFQIILAAWTAMIALWVFAAFAENMHASYYERQGFVASLFCIFGAWCVIGIPCGIAAILTLDARKP